MSVDTNKNNKISKWAILKSALFGLSFILVASINDNPTSKDKRTPASIPAVKTPKAFIKNPLIKHTKKLAAPMMTYIVNNSGDNNGNTFTLTGYLKTSSNIKNVELKWALPDGFTIVNGTETSYITSASPGQDYQFQITVKSNSSANEVVHLVARSQIGESYYSNSSQFHTKINEELKQAHQDLHERAKKYMEANN